MRSTLFLLVVLVLITSGCFNAVEDGPIIVVTASYPGASAQVVADTVAAPIEQQINGVEWMVRLESESRNNGSYIACVRFKPHTDPKAVVVLVQNRVALAEPVLPEAVRRAGVAVKARATEESENRVTIALVDRGDHGGEALRRFSDAALKRLSRDGAIVKPESFPGPDEGRLRSGPTGVYRVDMYPAVRITGLPPEGTMKGAAASRCAALADAERQSQNLPASFGVVNLTAR